MHTRGMSWPLTKQWAEMHTAAAQSCHSYTHGSGISFNLTVHYLSQERYVGGASSAPADPVSKDAGEAVQGGDS